MVQNRPSVTVLLGLMIAVPGGALMAVPSASAEEVGTSVEDCIHNEDEEDQVWVELCYALDAGAEVTIGDETRVPVVTVGFEDVVVDEEEEITIDTGDICILFCVGVNESESVGVSQSFQVPVPNQEVTDVTAGEINDITLNPDGTRQAVHPDRACSDLGIEFVCSLEGPPISPEPDPEPIRECLENPCMIQGASSSAITALADADDDGQWDGVIVDPNASVAGDTNYYLGFEQLSNLT